MYNRPDDAPDEFIHRMNDDGAPALNAETILGNRPAGLLAVYVPAETPLIEIARAFASIGFVLRGKRDGLLAEPARYGIVDISQAIDDGIYVTPPIDDDYRERRLTEFSPL